MSNNEVKVGAIIPNHNYGKWIAGAIYSIVNQTYPLKSIMVIDDGSTDDSWDIICRGLRLGGHKQEEKLLFGEIDSIPTYAYRFPKAGGPSRTRNKGIQELWDKVDAFQFLDADDELRATKIEKGVKKLIENPMVGAVYSDYDTINESTGLLFREYKEPFNRERLTQECIVNNNTLVAKKAFEVVGLYDEEMRTCEDYDLWMRVSERFLICHIPEPLMFLRVGGHSSTSTVTKDTWIKNWRRVMEKAQLRATNGQK